MADIVSASVRLTRGCRPRGIVCGALVAVLVLISTASSALARRPLDPSRCPGAFTPISQGTPGEMRQAVVCLINQQRTADQLPSLVASAKLDRSAQGWTDSMVASGQFTHGSAFMNRISATGFDWSTVGENIATGYATPAAVVGAWMQSPGHCANILDPAYREVGTGVSAQGIPPASSSAGSWTQDFGRLMNQPALSGNDGPEQGCYGH